MHARLGFVEFLNDEVRSAAPLERSVSAATRRRLLLAALSGRYAFPMKVRLRGYVVGARDVEGLPAEAIESGAEVGRAANGRYLEVVPEGFTKDAFDVMGPLLVPLRRGLDAGSVLTLELEILDPVSYELQPAGLVTRIESCLVEVAVEP